MKTSATTVTRFVAALCVPVALLLGGPTGSPSEPFKAVSEAPVAAERVVADNAPLTFDSPKVSTEAAPVKVAPEPVSEPVAKASTAVSDPVAWVHGVAAEAGLSFGGVRVEVTSEGNCGSGCTYVWRDQSGKIIGAEWVKIQPSIIGTDFGKYVVLHELGHVNGIVGECEAVQFAINHGASPYRDAKC